MIETVIYHTFSMIKTAIYYTFSMISPASFGCNQSGFTQLAAAMVGHIRQLVAVKKISW